MRDRFRELVELKRGNLEAWLFKSPIRSVLLWVFALSVVLGALATAIYW